MEIAITTISRNGQVVIPSDVRKEAGLTPSTKFIVFNLDGNILLKQIKKEGLRKDLELLERIHRSELQVLEGDAVTIDAAMDAGEIDDLLRTG